MDLGPELNHEQAPTARRRLLDPLRKGAHVILDLAHVTRVDTSGVAVLVEAARHARDRGACLSLGPVSDAAKAALEVARIDTLFPPAEEVR